jgi:hypothetical protein
MWLVVFVQAREPASETMAVDVFTFWEDQTLPHISLVRRLLIKVDYAV